MSKMRARSLAKAVEYALKQGLPVDWPGLRKAVRVKAGVHPSCPVHVVEGDAEPQLVGKLNYWTPHPKYRNAREYHKSTRRAEVGRGWVVEWVKRQFEMEITADDVPLGKMI